MPSAVTSPTPASRAAPPWWAVLALVYAAYVLSGGAGLMLALRPGYASPLFPAAGVALVAVLVWGRPAALAVALASVSLNLWLGADRAPFGPPVAAAALGIGLGAMAQAGVGAALVRRFVAQPLTLAEPRDLLRFYLLGAAAACLINAGVATGVLSAAGLLADDARWANAWIWWTGDMLGVLIGAPIVLTLIGRPRSAWVPRRLSVGLPMFVVTLLMALGTLQLLRLDEARRLDAFEREATAASSAILSRLQEPLRALEATRGLFIASDEVDRGEFRRATASWLLAGFGLQALGWSEAMPRSAVPGFEAAVRAEGLPAYRVFDRSDAGVATPPNEVMAIRYIEPQGRNAGALGVNTMSIAVSREALAATARTDRPAATRGFALTQGGVGTVVYHAVYLGAPTTAGERLERLRGVVFVTLRPDDLFSALGDALPHHLRACLLDNDPASPQRVLAGAAGCDKLPRDARLHVRPVAFAGRQWDVRVFADPAAPSVGPVGNAWPFAVVGLLATALLGALLLTVTGRARRIEIAVAERTADLQREIAERQRTEAALRASEQRFRVIFDAAPVGMVYTDMDGRIRQTNPAYCQLTGYSEDELRHLRVADLTHVDDRGPDVQLFARLASGELPHYQRSKRYVRKDGAVRWVRVHVRALDSVDGTPTRTVGVIEDITEHLLLQEAERARERAEAANRAKSDFVSRMSHELRTPLNAMLGFSQLLELDRQQPLAAHQMEWTGQIQHAGWHLLHMINDTLDLSRIESGNLRLQLEPLDVADMLRAARSLLEQNAQRRGITVTQRLDPQAPSIQGDLTRVKQILTNLLSNAIKYNVDGGAVTLSTRLRDEQTVEIEVADTGLGMSDSQLAELFQPFNRLGRESTGQEGTGIGLVISQRLAELMGGALTVRSRVDHGSVFTLTLPRARNGRTPQALNDSDEALLPSYRRRVVHYIEDNDTNAEVMRGILSQRPQIQLDVSTSGLDGLAAIRQNPPNLVLLDMHLPDIDGLELLRHLKADTLTAEIPVVVVSADATTQRIQQALTAGAAQYLTKPVNVHEILTVLDQQLASLDTRFG